MLKKIFKLWLKTGEGIVRLSLLFISLGLFFGLNFFFAYQFLRARGLVGNDIYNIFSHLSWLAQFFPRLPFWYPVEGLGTSLQYGYPIFSHLITIFVSHLSGLSIIESFRWLGFLNAFLFAVGIYFYGWLRRKSQLVGFLAALFYLLSPLAYCSLFAFGFYAESLALVFVPWAIISFEFFQENSQKGKKRKMFCWLLAALLFWGFASLAHYLAGIGLFTLFFLETVFSFFPRGKFSRRRFRRGLRAFLLFVLFAFGLWAFRLIPSIRFLSIANREKLKTNVSFEQIDYYVPHLKTLLGMNNPQVGLSEFKDADYMLKDHHFALPVSLLFLGGSLVCLFVPGLRVFVLLIWILFLTASSPQVTFFLMKKMPFGSYYFLNRRALFIVARLMVPVVAAAGLWRFGEAIYQFLVKLATGKKRKNWLADFIKTTLLVPLILIAVGFLFYRLRRLPEDPPWLVRGGWNGLELGGAFDLRDIWQKRKDDVCRPQTERPLLAEKLCQFPAAREKFSIIELETICVRKRDAAENLPDFCQEEKINQAVVDQLFSWCRKNPGSPYCQAQYDSLAEQFSRENWPKLAARDEVSLFNQEGEDLLKSLKEKGVERYDISPQLSGFITGSTYYTDVSRIGLYTHQLSLNHGMWGYLQGLFYTVNDTNRGSGVVEELARWFGIETIFLRTADPVGNFADHFWNKYDTLWNEELERETVTVLEAKEPLSLAELSSRPVFLVIGDLKKDSFNTLFKLANRGVFPYDDFWLVEGESADIDHYELEELSKFDGLILHGYGYRSRHRAWGILDRYLKKGGTVFLNAGWQYAVPDWEIDKAPEFLPVKQTKWTDYGQAGNFWANEQLLKTEIAETGFSPLVWEDKPWGVSGITEAGLRDWAKVILAIDDQPLLVGGDYGQGRVIWSGLNIFAHSLENKNQAEMSFLKAVFNWLSKEREKKNSQLEIIRDNPDRVKFVFQEDFSQGWLLWKEAFFPDWRAQLNGVQESSSQPVKVPIYRAGPGLMIFPLSGVKKDDFLELFYQEPFFFKGLRLLTILSLGALLVLIVKPNLIGGFQLFACRRAWTALKQKWESEEI